MAALACLVCAGCATVPLTGRQQLAFIPQSQLLGMSQRNYQQLLEDEKVADDEVLQEKTRRVGNRIAVSAEEFMRERGMQEQADVYEWEFTVLEGDDTINAFCMPGGKIGVYTGMFDVAETDDELAVVIAHEIAHAMANHGGERMSHLLLAQLGGLTLATAVTQKPEETRRIAMAAYGLGTQIGILLPYSRVQEYEADTIGLSIMARAGYDPRTAIDFWNKMREKGPSMPEFLSTHPLPDSRIESIEDKIPEAMAYYREGPE